MALKCGVCNRKMTAFNSIRCRKCRMLVCEKCISGASRGEGAVCKNCTPADEKVSQEESSFIKNSMQIIKAYFTNNIFLKKLSTKFSILQSNSKYFIFGFLLVLTFLLLVFMPKIEAKYYRYKLSSESSVEAEFAENALIANAGESVKSEMIAELDTGTDSSRMRAMRVLGETGCRRALPKLRGIAADSEEDLAVRAQARESIILIEEY